MREMENHALIPHLFRSEYAKIVSVLCKQFGLSHIETAEDIASETFMAALETWPYRGLPENPGAWLYTTAKNKTKNLLARQQLFAGKISGELAQGAGVTPASDDPDLSETNIADSQLQMLFAICDPAIPVESQVGLALRILCGFGTDEIANAFLSNRETITKRLQRAKEKLRQSDTRLELPPASEIPGRTDMVLLTIYLLFSEGYYSANSDHIIREELCLEAMRLTGLLLNSPLTASPKVNALMALMCFHASRFAARQDENGEVILYDDQDESLWNQQLIAEGARYFRASASGEEISTYHLEAGIAYWNTVKNNDSVKWENILMLYNRLLKAHYSPIAALNRTFALAKVKGYDVALTEAELLNLTGHLGWHLLLAELYLPTDTGRAIGHFEKAAQLCRSASEKQRIEKRILDVQGKSL